MTLPTTSDGVPFPSYWRGLIVCADKFAGTDRALLLFDGINGYMTATDSGNWNFDWVKFATATPPQKFTAPLSDGYSGTLSYLKTQENIVIVSFDVYKTDNSAINGTNLIATLPEGFRGLSGYCAALATGVGGGSIVGAAQAWCDAEGILGTLCPSGTYRIRGEIVFCAN